MRAISKAPGHTKGTQDAYWKGKKKVRHNIRRAKQWKKFNHWPVPDNLVKSSQQNICIFRVLHIPMKSTRPWEESLISVYIWTLLFWTSALSSPSKSPRIYPILNSFHHPKHKLDAQFRFHFQIPLQPSLQPKLQTWTGFFFLLSSSSSSSLDSSLLLLSEALATAFPVCWGKLVRLAGTAE